MARGRWWKLYFYCAVVLTVCSVSVLIWGNDEIHNLWWDWAYVPLYVFQAISLFGFVYMRPIAGATLWKTLFVISVAYEIWNAYDMATSWVPMTTPIAAAVVIALVYFVQIPLWYGNFLYGFRCKELWNAKT